jgi:hypothetical protein
MNLGSLVPGRVGKPVPFYNKESLSALERYVHSPGSYLAEELTPPAGPLPSADISRRNFNSIYNAGKPDEKLLLRQAWAEFFGFDVWYPYYKAKEVESWVKERCSVKLFKLKGSPEFKKGFFTFNFNGKF